MGRRDPHGLDNLSFLRETSRFSPLVSKIASLARMSAFSVLLRRCLAESGMTQMDLARAVSTSSSVVSQACTGQRPPPLLRMEAWAQALRLTAAKREAFLTAAQLAHAPEPVQRRVDRLERRLREGDGPGWDVHDPRSGDAAALVRALRVDLAACRARAEGPITDAELADAAWEVHGMLAAVLLQLEDGWFLEEKVAHTVYRHLARAVAACRAARLTRPATVRTALRRIPAELAKVARALDAGAPRPRPRG